jgi:hypothetical protein
MGSSLLGTVSQGPGINKNAAAIEVDLEEGIGPSPAGVDSASAISLALSASAADPTVTRELGGFRHEQREPALKPLTHGLRAAGLRQRRSV